jgi:uncharacterized protein YsxB (DUF464 family)
MSVLSKICASIGFFLVLSFSSFSQEIDPRFKGHYTIKEIQDLQKNNPQEYQFLINALDKGMFISDIPQEKEKDVKFHGELTIDPNEAHTFLSIGKKITDEYQYYRITGTNKMVVVLPRIFLEPK